MTSGQGDRHAKPQINVRLDPDLIVRLRDENQRQGRTITDIIEAGATAELDRLNGIAAPAPVVFIAAEDERPAGNNCKHRNMKMSKGVCPDCREWVVKP